MNELLVQLGTYIGSNGFGTPGTDIFAWTMPGTPYACTVFQSPGGVTIPGDPIERRTIRILHRNTSTMSGASYINSLYALLKNNWSAAGCDFPGRLTPDFLPGQFIIDNNNHFVFALSYSFNSIG